MSSFTWDVDGEMVEIIFNLIRNAGWVNEDRRDAIHFEYLDHPFVSVSTADLDIEENERDRDLWNMLLQVTNLDAT